jgi:hypothetical protein
MPDRGRINNADQKRPVVYTTWTGGKPAASQPETERNNLSDSG